MEFLMNDTLSGHHGPVNTFAVEVGNPDLAFRAIHLAEPMPTARQILDEAGAHPAEDHVALALLPNGDTEALRLDETLDLRGRGIERVIIFKTDRVFRLEVDRREKEWGLAKISGLAIKFLAGVDPAKHDVYQEVRGNDPLIRDDDSLTCPAKASSVSIRSSARRRRVWRSCRRTTAHTSKHGGLHMRW
jgi:Multiubiquitin